MICSSPDLKTLYLHNLLQFSPAFEFKVEYFNILPHNAQIWMWNFKGCLNMSALCLLVIFADLLLRLFISFNTSMPLLCSNPVEYLFLILYYSYGLYYIICHTGRFAKTRRFHKMVHFVLYWTFPLCSQVLLQKDHKSRDTHYR